MSATGSATLSRTSPLLARLRPRGRRLAGFLDHARQVEREALGILDEVLVDRGGFRRVLADRRLRVTWSLTRHFLQGLLLTHYHETCLTVQR